jgi:putative ABC transport system ATP-binding protein
VLFLVGHDPRLLPYADRVMHLVDGRLSDERVPSPTELPS